MMSECFAEVRWTRGADEPYLDNAYSRGHEWRFDGGVTVPASSSPDVVPPPQSVSANVDPEEAFVASLSSCHMLSFLAIAAKRRFVVDRYVDHAAGTLAKGGDGKVWMTRVVLRPRVEFSGERVPTPEQLRHLHRQAHEVCFIASSVKTEVVTELPD